MQDTDIRRAVTATSAMPAATLPDSAFLAAPRTPALLAIPQQTGSLAQRAIEERERNLCENTAVAILEQMQTGRPARIKKDGGEMLIAIVLDRPLAEASRTQDEVAPAEATTSSSRSYSQRAAKARPPTHSHIQFQ